MGLTKHEIFTQEQNELALIAKALGHPARIAIMQHLAELNACVCGEIVDHLGLAQSTVSQHLKELKKAGLIKGSIEGTSICYCIDVNRWVVCQQVLGSFFDKIVASQSCC